ncbi:hypothetical protein CEXT_101741 [Caerostris extrusa]|uniref:LAGLIDADG homing endonuclease n=1 Tax=Caerostris extrusa TaxID=172846 RepID=A0AAV4MZX3_CAEEX|nr:hypothetical protein CEXT_101741 [Caerostris extrusa]
MKYRKNKRFATKDKDHESLSGLFKGAWWVYGWTVPTRRVQPNKCSLVFVTSECKPGHCGNETEIKIKVNQDISVILHISVFKGDGMQYNNNKRFATKDKDLASLAAIFKAAWWVYGWTFCHLNGQYLPGQCNQTSFHWYLCLENTGLDTTEMKLILKQW